MHKIPDILTQSTTFRCMSFCHCCIITVINESHCVTDTDRHTPLKLARNQQIYGSGTITYGSIAWQPPSCDVALSKEPTVDSSDCCINVINEHVLRIKK